MPFNIKAIHLLEQIEQIFTHLPFNTLVATKPGNLAVWDISDSALKHLPACGQQIEGVNVELQARKQFWSVFDPVAHRAMLPVSDFQENFLVLTYLQPIGEDFNQFFASASRDSSRN